MEELKSNENELKHRMEAAGSEKEKYLSLLKKLGAEVIEEEQCHGIRVGGWRIESKKRPILDSDARDEWIKNLEVAQLPEMVFGDSSLELVHEDSEIKIHFNAFDALQEWKKESLPPVEVPAAAKWKFRSKPSQQVILDYDYTFTTPYSGSEFLQPKQEKSEDLQASGSENHHWIECDERIDLVALQSKDPILFYDEVILYEDELADNGVSLLTVKVRVMPTCWFLLLRFWLRVDGVLMRVRDTRMFCSFAHGSIQKPLIIRERCGREETFKGLAMRGFPSYSSSYNDPNEICERLPIIWHFNEKLNV
eukprot:TRINITY_DN40443_c0_g1_i1.p1 TRINITY_DN40443_c0_g1~~TRINITY_DN40443_c0_g1_i1.p1  ORF type:complete len:308 (-),score=61.92 TRINITY_DN40443_c0_g1_i1:223-1146(-)